MRYGKNSQGQIVMLANCQRHKVNNRMYSGKLQPLSIPGRRWESVSIDLIVKLPTTADGHDSILVFVDGLSKMVHLVPTIESW